jgi:hypothetical protein
MRRTDRVAKNLWRDIKNRVDQSQTFGAFNDMDPDEERKLDLDCIEMIADALEELLDK